jgi:hypothetical protein
MSGFLIPRFAILVPCFYLQALLRERDSLGFFRPFRAWSLLCLAPRAYARGFILAPLRGFSAALQSQVAFQPQPEFPSSGYFSNLRLLSKCSANSKKA